MFTKRSESNKRLIIWHIKSGAVEYRIIWNDLEKSLPRSRGKVISPKIHDVAYIVIKSKPKHLIATKMEYMNDNSELENKSEPVNADSETRVIRGKRKLFLACMTEFLSESNDSHIFAGEKIMFFKLLRKNL
jgi:hypothetical protein